MQDLFENSSIKRAYFTLAMPVVLNMAVSLIYNIVDTFFVAQTQKPDLVAGVSQGAPLFTLMIAFGDIFGLGGSSVISRLFGEKRYQLGRKVSGYCFWVPIFFGIAVSILLVIFQTPFLRLLGASSNTWQYAWEYYMIIAVGAPFIIFSYSPINILRTEGLAVESMKGSMVGTVINIFLNPFFIFTCHLGAAGSALATVVSNVIADIVLVHYIRHRAHHLTASIHETKISGHLQAEVYAIGIPASVTNLMSTFAMAFTNHYLITYGANSVASMGIAMKVSMIINMIFVGFAFGAQPLIGYVYGAKDTKRFNKVIKLDLSVVCGFALSMTAIMFFVSPLIVRCFMHSPEIIKEGTTMVRWLISSSTFAGAILVFTTMFQSMGKALPAFILSFSRQGIVLAIVMVILAKVFGYTGILAAQPTADLITSVISVVLFMLYRPRIKENGK